MCIMFIEPYISRILNYAKNRPRLLNGLNALFILFSVFCKPQLHFSVNNDQNNMLCISYTK